MFTAGVAGHYLFAGGTVFSLNNDGRRIIVGYAVNGVLINPQVGRVSASAATQFVGASATEIFNLSLNDTVELQGWHNDVGNHVCYSYFTGWRLY